MQPQVSLEGGDVKIGLYKRMQHDDEAETGVIHLLEEGATS